MKYSIFIAVILLYLPSLSYSDRSLTIKAAGNANATLMSTPPLPQLSGAPKGVQYNFQLASFTAKTDPEDTEGQSDPLESNVDYNGTALSTMISNSGSGALGWYVLVSANQLSGSFSSTFAGFEVRADDVQSAHSQAGLGVSISLFRKSALPAQVFGGPSYTRASVRQVITSEEGDDFDMTVNPSSLSYFLGAQIEIPVLGLFRLNPYLMMSDFFTEESKCHEFSAEVRSYGPQWDFSDPDCQGGDNTSTSTVLYDTSFVSYGVNLVLPLTSLVLRNICSSTNYYDNHNKVIA